MVLRAYVSRLMYQTALAAGGPRRNLDGNPTGEVSDQERAGAQRMVALIEEKRAAAYMAKRAARKRRVWQVTPPSNSVSASKDNPSATVALPPSMTTTTVANVNPDAGITIAPAGNALVTETSVPSAVTVASTPQSGGAEGGSSRVTGCCLA